MRAAIVFLLPLVLLAAGCADAPNAPASTQPTNAPPPVAGEDVGSLNGLVVDEESRPLADVTTSLVEPSLTARTDAAGRFTYNNITPGTYSLVVERIGFAPTGKKVDVVAGEVTDVKLTLTPVTLAQDPYQLTIPRSAYINFGLYAVNTAARLVNHSTVNELTCNPCALIAHFPTDSKAILFETLWKRANEAPMVNQGIDVDWHQPSGASWSNIGTTVMTSRDSHLLGAGDVAILTKYDRLMVAVMGAVYEGVMLQQKLDFYISLAYVDEFPEGFTALPPA